MTCRRRLGEWNKAGVWQRLHEVLLYRLRAADALDFSRTAVDSSHIRALKGGSRPGRLRSDPARSHFCRMILFVRVLPPSGRPL